VRGTGFEPASPYGRYHLKVVRLPVSPPAQLNFLRIIVKVLLIFKQSKTERWSNDFNKAHTLFYKTISTGKAGTTMENVDVRFFAAFIAIVGLIIGIFIGIVTITVFAAVIVAIAITIFWTVSRGATAETSGTTGALLLTVGGAMCLLIPAWIAWFIRTYAPR
jgi:hypothetical protein